MDLISLKNILFQQPYFFGGNLKFSSFLLGVESLWWGKKIELSLKKGWFIACEDMNSINLEISQQLPTPTYNVTDPKSASTRWFQCLFWMKAMPINHPMMPHSTKLKRSFCNKHSAKQTKNLKNIQNLTKLSIAWLTRSISSLWNSKLQNLKHQFSLEKAGKFENMG